MQRPARVLGDRVPQDRHAPGLGIDLEVDQVCAHFGPYAALVPSCAAFIRRSSIGSRPSFLAISSTTLSTANSEFGAPGARGRERTGVQVVELADAVEQAHALRRRTVDDRPSQGRARTGSTSAKGVYQVMRP